jgi:hypothetical protein
MLFLHVFFWSTVGGEGDLIEENEIGWTCKTQGDGKYVQSLIGWEIWKEETTWRSKAYVGW